MGGNKFTDTKIVTREQAARGTDGTKLRGVFFLIFSQNCPPKYDF